MGYSVPIDPKDARPHLVALYGRHCQACGRRPPEVRLTTDHVVPYALGGQDRLENYQLLCEACNQMKGAEVIDFRLAGAEPSVPGVGSSGYEEDVTERFPVEPSADGSTPAAPAAPDDDPHWLTFTDIEPPEHSGAAVTAEVLRLDDGRTVAMLGPIDLYDNKVSFKAQPDGTIRMKFNCKIALALNQNATELIALPKVS